MDNCVFCKIVSGKLPCHKIYEDDNYLAFLDIKPVNPGHVLVIPKGHHKMMLDTPDETVSGIFILAKKLMLAVKDGMMADYVALAVVGTDVPHFHIHLTPRYFKDGMQHFWPTKIYKKGEEPEIVKAIKKSLK